MSEHFLTSKQVRDLFVKGPLHTLWGRLAALLPFALIIAGLTAGVFFEIRYTFNQIFFGFGSLFLLTVYLPYVVQWVRDAKTND